MRRIATSIVLQAALALLVIVAARVPALESQAAPALREHSRAATRASVRAPSQGYVVPADWPRPPLGRFTLTAYSGPQTGQRLPITATGVAAQAGRTIAVDPAVIPLGSAVYIDGLGVRIAEDVGGAVKGRRLDVYLPTREAARRFGVQYRRVAVLSPGRDGEVEPAGAGSADDARG